MKRFTFKKWFEHYKPDEETTTILVNGYTQIVEPAFDFEETSLQAVANCYLVGKAIDKLAEYEDAEEHGLLLRLPVPIGTEVHEISKCFAPNCEKCIAFGWNDYCNPEFHGKIYTHPMTHGNIPGFGKSVFLTKAEAEKALAKMEDGK